MTTETIDFLLAFADDEHLMGQQHTEWIGVAPSLEQDLSLSSIGQDELGHAVLLYELVLELGGKETSDLEIDKIAYKRTETEYRSSAFVEYSTNDWAEALVRHWIYDTVELERWSQVVNSSSESLASIAAVALRDEQYHLRHANAVLDPLLQDQDARELLLAGLQVILPLVPSLLTPTRGQAEAQASGLTTGSIGDLAEFAADAISVRFGQPVAGLEPSEVQHSRTRRSAHFGPLMRRMREVLDYDPQAVW